MLERITGWILNRNRFNTIDTEELSILDLVGKTAHKVNEFTDEINNKVDITGDFKGTWQGLHPVQTPEGQASVVAGLSTDVNRIDGEITLIQSDNVLQAGSIATLQITQANNIVDITDLQNELIQQEVIINNNKTQVTGGITSLQALTVSQGIDIEKNKNDLTATNVIVSEHTNLLGTAQTTNAIEIGKKVPKGELVINVKDYGAVGDKIHDDSINIQNAINYAMTVGKNVYFPSGEYLITQTLVIDNSTSNYFLDKKKINLVGSGLQTTVLYYTGASACLKYIGGKTGVLNSFQAYQSLRDIQIRGANNRSSIGVSMDTMSFFEWNNVDVTGFNTGIACVDCDNHTFFDTIIHWNYCGLYMEERQIRNPLTSCRPNNISFFKCHIGGNYNNGAIFLGGSNINFFGGNIEGNGLGGDSLEPCALIVQDGCVQGGIGLNMQGVFIESNKGIASIKISSVLASGYGANEGLYIINGCSFNKWKVDTVSSYDILINFNHLISGQQKVIIENNAFKNNAGYTPSVSRPHLLFGIDARSKENCVFKNNLQTDDVEKIVEDTLDLPTNLMIKPNSTVGAIGEFKSISSGVGQPLILPTGGVWEWSGYWVVQSTGVVSIIAGGSTSGVSNGDTQILEGYATYLAVATIRRIS